MALPLDLVDTPIPAGQACGAVPAGRVTPRTAEAGSTAPSRIRGDHGPICPARRPPLDLRESRRPRDRAAGGIGRAVARELHARGSRLVLLDLDLAAVRDAARATSRPTA